MRSSARSDGCGGPQGIGSDQLCKDETYRTKFFWGKHTVALVGIFLFTSLPP